LPIPKPQDDGSESQDNGFDWPLLKGWNTARGACKATPFVLRKAKQHFGNYKPPAPLDECLSHQTVKRHALGNAVHTVYRNTFRKYNQGFVSLKEPLTLPGQPRGTVASSHVLQDLIHFRCGSSGTHAPVHTDEVGGNTWSLLHQVHGHKIYLIFAPPEDALCEKLYVKRLDAVLKLDYLEKYVQGEEQECKDLPVWQLISKVRSKICNYLRQAQFPTDKYELIELYPGDTLWFLASHPHAAINVGKWTMCLLHNTYTERYLPAHLDEIIDVGGEGTPKSEKVVETWSDIAYVRRKDILKDLPEVKEKMDQVTAYSSLAKKEEKTKSQRKRRAKRKRAESKQGKHKIKKRK